MKKILLLSLMIITSSLAFSFSAEKVSQVSTGACPKAVVISPDGKTAYSLNLEGMSVDAFHTETKKKLWRLKFIPTPAKGWDYRNKRPISSYAEKPVEANFTGNGRYLWVSLHNGEKVVVIDTLWKEEFKTDLMKAKLYPGQGSTQFRSVHVKEIEVGKTPKVIAVSPDQKWVYVANWHSHTISVIDSETFKVVKNTRVVRIPRGMVFTPDGRYAFVANMGSTLMSKIDVRNGHKLIKNYKVGLTPRHIVISKDGQFLYISLNRPGNIVKFDIQEERVVKNIHVGHHPRTIVLSPDDQELYVVLYKDNKFLALSTDTLKPLRKYSTGHHPVGIDVTPDGKEIWVANYGSSSLGIFNVIP